MTTEFETLDSAQVFNVVTLDSDKVVPFLADFVCSSRKQNLNECLKWMGIGLIYKTIFSWCIVCGKKSCTCYVCVVGSKFVNECSRIQQ